MLWKAPDTLRYNKDVDDPKQVTIENKIKRGKLSNVETSVVLLMTDIQVSTCDVRPN